MIVEKLEDIINDKLFFEEEDLLIIEKILNDKDQVEKEKNEIEDFFKDWQKYQYSESSKNEQEWFNKIVKKLKLNI